MGSLFSSRRNEPLPELYTEIWRLIIQNVEDPNPKNCVIYLLWIMQVNKVLEKIVREHFEKRYIKPSTTICGICNGSLVGVFSSFKYDETREFHYGITTKCRSFIAFSYDTIKYRIVHNREIMVVKFMFDSKKCKMVDFKCRRYAYRIELPGSIKCEQYDWTGGDACIRREVQWCFEFASKWAKRARRDMHKE